MRRPRIIGLSKGVTVVIAPDGKAASCLTTPEARERFKGQGKDKENDPEKLKKHDEIQLLFRENMHRASSRLIDELIKKPRKKRKDELKVANTITN